MRDVDVETGVMADPVRAVDIIFGLCSSRWVPEVGPVRFEDSSSGTYLSLLAQWLIVDGGKNQGCRHYDIGATKLPFCNIEHVREFIPIDNVGFDKGRARLGGVIVDEPLSLRT